MRKTKQERNLESTTFTITRDGETLKRCFSDLEWWEAAEVIRDWDEEACEGLYQKLREAYDFIIEGAEQENSPALMQVSALNIKEDLQESSYFKCLKMHERLNFLAAALNVKGYQASKVEQGFGLFENYFDDDDDDYD